MCSADVGREAEFSVLLPLDAFITSFSMTIDGVTYDGTIREKEEAQRIFNVAKVWLRYFCSSIGFIIAISYSLVPFFRIAKNLIKIFRFEELLTVFRILIFRLATLLHEMNRPQFFKPLSTWNLSNE